MIYYVLNNKRIVFLCETVYNKGMVKNITKTQKTHLMKWRHPDMKKKTSFLQNLGAVAYAVNRTNSTGALTSADRDCMKNLHNMFR